MLNLRMLYIRFHCTPDHENVDFLNNFNDFKSHLGSKIKIFRKYDDIECSQRLKYD